MANLLDLTSLKILSACSHLWGCERQIFNYKWVSEVCISFPPNVISLNKILSHARLSRNTERQKVHFIVLKTRTKRIGEARNYLQYSFYFTSEQIEYFISVHWRVVSIYWALMWWVIHHSICSMKRSYSCWSHNTSFDLARGLLFAL